VHQSSEQCKASREVVAAPPIGHRRGFYGEVPRRRSGELRCKHDTEVAREVGEVRSTRWLTLRLTELTGQLGEVGRRRNRRRRCDGRRGRRRRVMTELCERRRFLELEDAEEQGGARCPLRFARGGLERRRGAAHRC
jgi:hypothetical protein